jgi:hypothetical protein
MTYIEKLKDPRWQKKRLEIFQRDDFTCRFCGRKDKSLHLHHTEYINAVEPWEYPDESLLTICEDCHFIEYEYRKEYESKLIVSLRNNKFSTTHINMLTEMIGIMIQRHHHGIYDMLNMISGMSEERIEKTYKAYYKERRNNK